MELYRFQLREKMIPRLHLTTLIGLIFGIWAFFMIVSGIAITSEFFKPFSLIVGIVGIILLLFDKLLWKFPIIHSLFVSFPDISGTWKGQIISTWKDEKTGEVIPPIDAFLVIDQTYSKLNLRMMTKESKSDLLSGNFIPYDAGPQKIAGIYNNIPDLLVRDKSPIHYGGLLLELHTGKRTVLEGEYWTDRDTKGTLRFDKRMKNRCDDFDSALSLLQSHRYQNL
jgi:hypothetical protein